ncbi:hypothetical protein RB195_001932 [Necator americanus]|uniref:Uncharacterized protein n=1 Tax=Necator americanus TaxID=51031 RepID=A0ABR1DGK7_NECAM
MFPLLLLQSDNNIKNVIEYLLPFASVLCSVLMEGRKLINYWINYRPKQELAYPMGLVRICSEEGDDAETLARIKITSNLGSAQKVVHNPFYLFVRVRRVRAGRSHLAENGTFWTEVVKEDRRTLGVDRQFRRDVKFRRTWNSDEWIDSVQALAEDREGWAELCSRTAHLGEDAGNRVRR